MLEHCTKLNISFLSTAWSLFIGFDTIKNNNVRFIDGIVAEDSHFSVLMLLILKTNIFKTDNRLYHYRIRPKSISNTMRTNILDTSSSKYHYMIYKSFNMKDLGKAKQYYYYASLIITGLKIIEDSKNSNNSELIIKQITPMYISYLTLYLASKTDPFNIIKLTKELKPYIKYYRKLIQFAILYPNIFRMLYPLIKTARYIKMKIRKS